MKKKSKVIETVAEEVPQAKVLDFFRDALTGGAKSAEMSTREQAKRQEDKILNDAQRIIHDALLAPDLNPDKLEKMPKGWVERFNGDKERARQAWRTARHCWSKSPPAFVTVALSQAAAITKARATEKGGARTLNIQAAQVVFTPQSFPILDVEDDGDR